ncbi:FAD-binding oxidoreductase [Aliifodinibius salicampi]|uniref:D-amino-acid oxidase n=1 Tax=Fodinibius salicampi TaxID=1920655 RepID=A0ABT3PX27_9BACT|nr:FAD-dependent oxidoreductase [Fodinibius salicampi]MCW9712407.1 FAD-binding oxidoreductase [Fodinibius salicampi]
MNSEKIIIIGGGVSGITTALTLQLLGCQTEIYTEKKAENIADKNTHPEFASLFPSASVIPHSVYSNQLEELFQSSQSFFYELRKRSFPGLTLQKHFEVFEFEKDRPEYGDWMMNFNSLEEFHPREIPRRSLSQDVYGWAFDCIFADWPLYFPGLITLYKESGGEINQRKIQKREIPSLPADIIINCSGTGSPDLFDDPVEKQMILKGHLLHKPEASLITNSNDEIISYNYTPKASIYSDSSGNACDVYCYPRKDGWILGGSRESGFLDNNDSETEDSPIENTRAYKIDSLDIPSAVIDLNQEILNTTFGHSLEQSDKLSALMGYRYIRNKENGLRLDHETLDGKTVYHNYGHGGAGVTLSWGCAIHLANKIISLKRSQMQSTLLDRLEEIMFDKKT